MIKAIETRYKGYRFRSRLEARWAVFFDAEGIEWEYEKEGFNLPSGPYLPDFWLPQVEMWAEVKGQKFTDEEVQRCHELAMGTRHFCLLLEGPPAECAYWACGPKCGHTYTYDPGHPGPYLMDFIINSWYLHESRFYACTGERGDFPSPIRLEYHIDVASVSIDAARAARFEHGEAGS